MSGTENKQPSLNPVMKNSNYPSFFEMIKLFTGSHY